MAQAGGMGSAGPVTAEAGLDEVPLCVYLQLYRKARSVSIHFFCGQRRVIIIIN